MEETITVTQLNNRAKAVLTDSPQLKDIWVSGEISNCKCYSSGHYYFTLKDQGSEIRCAMFRSSRARIDFEPEDNMKVSAFGRIDIYVERGSYQYIVETMRRSGKGDLYLAYEALKNKLEAEGLFDSSRKRSLPKYPRRIGVVTSETGAVIHDIITTASHRFPADILLCPAQVQGEGAAATIVRGIETLNKVGVDVMIVGRGGGSIEDLWAFNEEPVARAIAASKVPVISAVGHETDFTIADFVADVRAPTPTGAAEMALRGMDDVRRQMDTMSRRTGIALLSVLERMKSRFKLSDSKLSPSRAAESVDHKFTALNNLSRRGDSAIKSSLDMKTGTFNVLDARLSPKTASETVSRIVLDLDFLDDRLNASLLRLVDNKKIKLNSASRMLDGLGPDGVLKRGYSFIKSPSGDVLTSVSQLNEGSDVEITMSDGLATASVREIRCKK